MAFPTIPDRYLDDFPKEPLKEKIKDTVVVAASKVNTGIGNILDFFILLIAATFYYFFTGLAIVLNRKLPPQWLRLGTHLGMSRVTSIIKNTPQKRFGEVSGTRNTPKRQFKVVDIDTKRPFKVMKSVK